MSAERSSANYRKSPRVRAFVAAGALLLAGNSSVGSCLNSSDSNNQTGGGVTKRIPSIVKNFPGKTGEDDYLYLDCVDYFQKTDEGVKPYPGKPWPRAIIYDSSGGTLWASEVEVEYGVRVVDENGEVVSGLSEVITHDYWLAGYNSGEAATSTYASANESLPRDNETWEDQLKPLQTLGTEDLPNIGMDPRGDGTQVTVVRLSPYFESDIIGDPQVYNEPGLVALECRQAVDNKPVADTSEATPGQILTIHVPPSTTQTIPPEQDAILAARFGG